MVQEKISRQGKDYLPFYRIPIAYVFSVEMPMVPILFLNKKELIDTSLVAPVTTRAASFRIFSSSFTPY